MVLILQICFKKQIRKRWVRFRKESDADKKIPGISGLVKKTDFNNKITEVESKMPSISGLATTSDIDKYKYMGYGIGFDSKVTFYFLMAVLVKMH